MLRPPVSDVVPECAGLLLNEGFRGVISSIIFDLLRAWWENGYGAGSHSSMTNIVDVEDNHIRVSGYLIVFDANQMHRFFWDSGRAARFPFPSVPSFFTSMCLSFSA